MTTQSSGTSSMIITQRIMDYVDAKLLNFEQTFTPSAMTVTGATALDGNTTIGTNSSTTLTINSNAVFNGSIDANGATVNSLTVNDNTVLGQDSNDTLIVNAATTFTSGISGNQLNVTGNVVLGTNGTNTVTSNGPITSPHCVVPTTSGNSFRLGSNDVILYTEYSANGNIFNDHSQSVIVVVKNIGVTSIVITYDSNNDTNVITPNSIATFLKISSIAFIPITTAIG